MQQAAGDYALAGDHLLAGAPPQVVSAGDEWEGPAGGCSSLAEAPGPGVVLPRSVLRAALCIDGVLHPKALKRPPRGR